VISAGVDREVRGKPGASDHASMGRYQSSQRRPGYRSADVRVDAAGLIYSTDYNGRLYILELGV
jgi:hypothetical protein